MDKRGDPMGATIDRSCRGLDLASARSHREGSLCSSLVLLVAILSEFHTIITKDHPRFYIRLYCYFNGILECVNRVIAIMERG